MVEYKFNKDGIEEMYNDTCDECFDALDNGTINDVKFQIKMGNQIITIPTNADTLETIFKAIEDCEKDYNY